MTYLNRRHKLHAIFEKYISLKLKTAKKTRKNRIIKSRKPENKKD